MQKMVHAFHNATEQEVSFELLEPAGVSLNIYDGMGRIIATPLNGLLESGYHSVNLNNQKFSAGIYFYAITVSDEMVTGKILIVR